MRSALTDEADLFLGLLLGADDYAVKPFYPKELAVRVKAALRRAKASSDAA
jgi:DNA-binding response OmpR family regulator